MEVDIIVAETGWPVCMLKPMPAGGFIGTHSLFFARICKCAAVLTFEANADTFPVLNDNIVANGAAAPLVHVQRSGQILRSIDSAAGGGGYFDEVVVDLASSRYYGLDKVQRRLEAVMPHGYGAGLIAQIWLLASSGKYEKAPRPRS